MTDRIPTTADHIPDASNMLQTPCPYCKTNAAIAITRHPTASPAHTDLTCECGNCGQAWGAADDDAGGEAATGEAATQAGWLIHLSLTEKEVTHVERALGWYQNEVAFDSADYRIERSIQAKIDAAVNRSRSSAG